MEPTLRLRKISSRLGRNQNSPEGNVGSFLNQGGIRQRRKADHALFVKKREGTKVVSSILQHYQ